MKALRRVTNETFQSLHVRNFRLFFSGQLISQIGNWLTLVAQTLLVLKLTGNGVALGALAVAQFGPVLILGPWAGLVADRSDKRRLLLIVQCIAMAQSFALAALAFSGHPQVWQIFAIASIGGVTIAFDNPARRAFVVEMVPHDEMHNAVSLNSALMTSSRIVGPALAGLLVATVGFGWCFLLDGLSYTAVIAGLWLIRTEELHPSKPAARAKHQVRQGLRYVRSVPELWVPLVMMGVVGTLSYNFQTVFPLFATRDLGGTGTTFTLLFATVSVGAFDRCAAHRAAQDDQRACRCARVAGVRGRDDAHGVRAERLVRVPDRCAARRREHRVPHRVDIDRADRVGSRDARARPRAPGDVVPREHADRWSDRRLGVPGVRGALGDRARRGGRAGRGRLGPVQGPESGRHPRRRDAGHRRGGRGRDSRGRVPHQRLTGRRYRSRAAGFTSSEVGR